MKTFYKTGDKFLINGDKYILACIEMGYHILINLRNGNLWDEKGHVKDRHSITYEEMVKIFGEDCEEHEIIGLTTPYPPEKTALELVDELAKEYTAWTSYHDLNIVSRLNSIKEAIIKEAKDRV